MPDTTRATRVSARPAGRTLAVAAVAAAAALVLGGCTGSHPDSHASTPSTPSASSGASSAASAPAPTQAAVPQPLSPQEATSTIMATPDAMPVLAHAAGTLEASTGGSKLVAEVLQVHTTTTSTQVVWRLRSASDASVPTSSFQLARPPLMDTRLLGVVDPATHTTYRPYTYAPSRGNGQDLACTCSTLPDQVGRTGEVLEAVVPPLPASVTTVDVTLPGFGTMKHVPVERAGA